MANRERYFKNASWMLFDKSITMGIVFVAGIFVARYLQPTLMGTWYYALSLSGLFGVVGVLGIKPILIRELVSDGADRERILGNAVILRFLCGLATTAILTLYAFAMVHQPTLRYLLILLGVVGVFQATDSYDCLFQARIRAKHGVLVRLTGAVFLGGIKLLLILLKLPLIWFGVSVLFCEMLMAGMYVFIGWRFYNISLFRFKFERDQVVYLLGQCWPLLLSGMATFIYLRIDSIMLRNMINEKAVGYYGVAVRLALAWNFIVVTTSAAFYPVIVRAAGVSEQLLARRLVQLYSLVLWLAICIGGGLAIIGSWLLPMLVGDSYRASVPVFQLLCLMGLFSGITMVSSYWLMVKHLQKYSMGRNIFGMIINVILNCILIPRYGIIGAAVASIMARLAATIGFMVFVPSMRIHLLYLLRSLNPYRIIEVIFDKENLLWAKGSKS